MHQFQWKTKFNAQCCTSNRKLVESWMLLQKSLHTYLSITSFQFSTHCILYGNPLLHVYCICIYIYSISMLHISTRFSHNKCITANFIPCRGQFFVLLLLLLYEFLLLSMFLVVFIVIFLVHKTTVGKCIRKIRYVYCLCFIF